MLHMKRQLFSATFFFLEWNVIRDIMEIFGIYFMIKTFLACLRSVKEHQSADTCEKNPRTPFTSFLEKNNQQYLLYSCLLSNEGFDKLRIDSAPPHDLLCSHLCVLYLFPLPRQPNPTSYVNVSVISRNKTTQGR